MSGCAVMSPISDDNEYTCPGKSAVICQLSARFVLMYSTGVSIGLY